MLFWIHVFCDFYIWYVSMYVGMSCCRNKPHFAYIQTQYTYTHIYKCVCIVCWHLANSQISYGYLTMYVSMSVCMYVSNCAIWCRCVMTARGCIDLPETRRLATWWISDTNARAITRFIQLLANGKR